LIQIIYSLPIIIGLAVAATGAIIQIIGLLVSGGGTFQSQVLPRTTNVFFDLNSFSATGETVTADLTIIYCHDMNWSGIINSPSLPALIILYN